MCQTLVNIIYIDSDVKLILLYNFPQMKNGHLLGKPIFHMHKSNIDEHVVEYFSHMEKSVKKCATMSKFLLYIFITCA